MPPDEPVIGREAAVETIKTVNGLSSDDTYLEVLSGETHHAAHFRLQVGDAAVNGIFFVLRAWISLLTASRPENKPAGNECG